jgi:hypothetical protein
MSYIAHLNRNDIIDFSYLKTIFINIFGYNFKSEFTITQIQNLISIIKKIDDNIAMELYKRQFHILYLIAQTLHVYNEDILQMESDEFYNTFYYPNIISIISSNMKEAKETLKLIIRATFQEVQDKCKDIVEYNLIFMNMDKTIMKNDILHLFLNTLFLDIDPLDLDNIKQYYTSNFRYLLYAYLKNKTTGLTALDSNPSILQEDSLAISTRLRIYDDGIKITQIQELCDKSNTYDRILNNYRRLKTDVIANELQRIYLYATTKTSTTDNRISILSTFDSDANLSLIKDKMPLIYRLLRSLHIVAKANPIDDNFKQLMYKSIYDILFLEFSKHISNQLASNLANNIAKKMTYSLTVGQYIDPLTMDSLSINTYTFLNQLKLFLEILVKNISNVNN